MLISDYVNPNTVYVGGINLHRTTNGGASGTTNPWTQISQWYGGTFSQVSYQYVHADQHGAAILESDPNKVLFVNDGEFSSQMMVEKIFHQEMIITILLNITLLGCSINYVYRSSSKSFRNDSRYSTGSSKFVSRLELIKMFSPEVFKIMVLNFQLIK